MATDYYSEVHRSPGLLGALMTLTLFRYKRKSDKRKSLYNIRLEMSNNT